MGEIYLCNAACEEFSVCESKHCKDQYVCPFTIDKAALSAIQALQRERDEFYEAMVDHIHETLDQREEITRLRKERDELKEWYESIMAQLENNGTISYYQCGSCGGPVSAGLCCVWCESDDPVTIPHTTYQENTRLKGIVERYEKALRAALCLCEPGHTHARTRIEAIVKHGLKED